MKKRASSARRISIGTVDFRGRRARVRADGPGKSGIPPQNYGGRLAREFAVNIEGLENTIQQNEQVWQNHKRLWAAQILEKILHFGKKAGRLRMRLGGRKPFEFVEKFFLTLGEVLRRLNCDLNIEVAFFA